MRAASPRAALIALITRIHGNYFSPLRGSIFNHQELFF
jgi:hypothetical protein